MQTISYAQIADFYPDRACVCASLLHAADLLRWGLSLVRCLAIEILRGLRIHWRGPTREAQVVNLY